MNTQSAGQAQEPHDLHPSGRRFEPCCAHQTTLIPTPSGEFLTRWGCFVFAIQTAPDVLEHRPEAFPRATPVGGVSVRLGGLVADAHGVRTARAVEQCGKWLSEDATTTDPSSPMYNFSKNP
ncbi:hypothetical protein OHS18_42000 [Amycolatopsis sp. NBC_00355]|uniref:hypothetical protein n=1 Tax=Amycolatopsis sp. NBC_00355 TaxID=2975957 RepID=UPI002E26B635